jgi:hypothetical protein
MTDLNPAGIDCSLGHDSELGLSYIEDCRWYGCGCRVVAAFAAVHDSTTMRASACTCVQRQKWHKSCYYAERGTQNPRAPPPEHGGVCRQCLCFTHRDCMRALYDVL